MVIFEFTQKEQFLVHVIFICSVFLCVIILLKQYVTDTLWGL